MSDDHLPRSHTCFFTIDYPLINKSYDETRKLICYKLYQAALYVEAGMAFSGGRKLRSTRPKSQPKQKAKPKSEPKQKAKPNFLKNLFKQ